MKAELKYMRKFAESWPDSAIVQRTVALIPWRSNLSLMDKLEERELENALISHVEKFLLELGQGFAFVGRQVHVEFEGDEKPDRCLRMGDEDQKRHAEGIA